MLLDGMSLVGQWDEHAHTYADVWGHGEFAYVTHFGNSGGVDIIDVSDPTNPTLATVFLGSSGFNDLKDVEVNANNIAFFSNDSGGGVYVVDVTDPYNPVELFRITSAIGGHNSVHTLSVTGNYLYEADSRTPNIKVFDVTNPSNPTFVRTIVSPSGGAVHEVTAIDGRLYTAVINTTGYADVFDISDVAASAPLITSFVTGPRAHTSWPTTDGNYLVVARETSGGDVRIFDISNPAAVTQVATITVPTSEAFSSHQVMVDGDRLYVSWYQAGVRVYDITDPATPTLVADYDTFPGAVSSFNGCWGVYSFLGSDRILASDMQTGLYVLAIPEALGYTAQSGNGADSLTLRLSLDGNELEVFDDNSGLVVARRLLSATTAVQISGAANEDDTLRIDFSYGGFFSVPGGISYSGGAAGADSLRIIGNGTTTGSYLPSATTPGDGSAVVAAGASTVAIDFTGLEPLEVSGMADFTLITPNSDDVLLVGTATGSGGQSANSISGTSGGVLIEPVQYFEITSFTIDTATNDGGTADDSITIGSAGFVAEDLQNFTVNSGTGSDTLTVLSSSFALPLAGGSFTFDAGLGTDRIVGSADVNFTLTDTGLASSGGGSIVFLGLAGDQASLTGGAGANTIDASGFTGTTTLNGGAGSDVLKGGTGSDQWIFEGTAANDTIMVQPDTVVGRLKATRGTEIDRFTFDAADQIHVLGGSGNDSVTVLATVSLPAILDGGLGNDTLTGGSGGDQLLGQDGDDKLNGKLGDDIVVGGIGIDTWTFEGTNNIDLLDVDWDAVAGQLVANRRVSGGSLVETDRASFVEKLSLLGLAAADNIDLSLLAAADITAAGLTGTTTVDGGAGADTIVGTAGKDSLVGGTGSDPDSLVGGAGNDTLSGALGNDTLDGGADNDSLLGGDGADSLLGGIGNDTLDGNLGNDTIDGGDGNDKLVGGDGNDSLVGGIGNDSLNGKLGDDTLDGGSGTDTWTFEGTNNVDFLDVDWDTVASQLVGNRRLLGGGLPVETDRAAFIEKLTVLALAAADQIDLSALDAADIAATGLTNPTTLDGGAGADTLLGSGGRDSLTGGTGTDNDSLVGGAGNDTLSGGLGNDTLDGGDGNDSMLGGDGNDSLDGGLGTDTINGGVGIDTCSNGEVVSNCEF